MTTAPPSLLFLVHRIPYPPNKGDKIRSYHLLRFLAERYRVHLGTFVDDEADWQYLSEIEKLCEDVRAVKLRPLPRRLASLRGLLTAEPLSLPYYRSATLATWVHHKIHDEGVSRVVAFSSPMAQYTPPNGVDLRRVVDFVDVDSEKWRQYAERRSWPLSWLYRREGERLLAFERRVAASSHASIFVTREEAQLFERRAGIDGVRVSVVVNGVDTGFFSPNGQWENPYRRGGPVLVFTGMMDYWANVDAVRWFAREIFPRIRAEVEGVRFVIVGARPTREVESLQSMEGVEVTGTVPDVRPFLAHAEVAVAPLRIARGIQNKILEAMAMARPVVATSAGVEGLELPAALRRNVADTASAFAEAAAGLLRAREAREAAGGLGRDFVATQHDWARTLSPVAGLLEERART